VDEFDPFYGFVITGPVMTFAKVSPANENPVRPFDKTVQNKDGIYPAGTHDPYSPNVGRILKSGHPRGIRRRIATPVT
jgi:hypothetical protein